MSPSFWKYLIASNKRSKYVHMWVDIASQVESLPIEFSYSDMCKKHGLSRTSLWRHMDEVKQDWNKLETNLEQTWNKGGFGFQRVTAFAETKVKQTWNKTETSLKQPKKPKREDENLELREKIVAYLNQKTGKRYKENNKQTRKDLQARIKEGYVFEDFCKVIDNKCSVWLDTERSIYLRPMTLFGNKFESYLNEVPQNPELFMHQKISQHATKAERYNQAISEAGEIDFNQFVEFDERE